MSTLRARCPDCRTLTAVAIDDEYQCHSCGREYAAGLVRVPRAWGTGGETMADAALLALPYPEAARDRGGDPRGAGRGPDPEPACAPARARWVLLLARRRDPRPRGAARPARGRLGRRPRRPQHARDLALGERLGDAAADGDRCRRGRARGRGARRRPQPRPARGRVHAKAGIDDDLDRALEGCDRVYVAFDCDVLRPGELRSSCPSPAGRR